MGDTIMENPLELKYIKLLRLTMSPIGGWPDVMLDDNSPHIKSIYFINIFVQFVVVVGEVRYLQEASGEDFDILLVGDVYITTFLTALSLMRLCLLHMKRYFLICKHFMLTFHLVYFKHKGDVFKDIYLLIDKISYYYTMFMSSMALSGTVLFNLSPMYVNFRNGVFTTNRHNLENITLQFSVNYVYPGYDPNEKFLFTTIINFYLSFLCSISIVAMDLLLILMAFQIIGHLEIIARNMKALPQPKEMSTFQGAHGNNVVQYEVERYDDQENMIIQEKLKEFINHHRLIINFTESISSFFGPMLACTYLFHLVSCCLLLLECTGAEADAIVRYGPLTSIVFAQLIQISVIFEILGSKSEALIESVYDLPWQCMSVRNQRTVCIMLHRVQSPIHVTAMGVTPVGVETMAYILKTTMSYFTFLRSL